MPNVGNKSLQLRANARRGCRFFIYCPTNFAPCAAHVIPRSMFNEQCKMFRVKQSLLIARRPGPAGRGNNSTRLFARLEALKSVVDVPRETIWDKGTLFKEQRSMLSVQQNVKHYSYFNAQWNVNNISCLRNGKQGTEFSGRWARHDAMRKNNVRLQNVNITSHSHYTIRRIFLIFHYFSSIIIII